jgi:small subunit ribosomal protein S6
MLHSCSPRGPPRPEEVGLRKYEIMLILPPEADDPVIEGATNRITQVLAASGGEIRSVDRWGKRRLAYELAKNTEGFYLVVQFVAEPDAVKELDRVLSLVDEVIRFKVVVRGEAESAAGQGEEAQAAAPDEAARTVA